MKNLKNTGILLLIMVAFQACNTQSYQSAKVETKADSASYMLGLSIGHSFKTQDIPDINAALVAKGINEVLTNDTSVSEMEINMFLNTYFRSLQEAKSAKSLEKELKFLEENKAKDGIQVTASGLQYKVIEEGTGKKPGQNDKVKVHYTGKLIDGTVFDSSVERGEPAEFTLGGVIPGWTEGLQLMKEGGKYELFVPSTLGYGPRGAGRSIGPNETLIFEIELLEVKPADNAK